MALDLAHLARQTLGDHELQAELLGLFAVQAVQILAELQSADGGDVSAKADLAHKLNGSARAIGAFCVAGKAEAYESALADGVGTSQPCLETLASAITAALSAIEQARQG